jgi:hypothetical protein
MIGSKETCTFNLHESIVRANKRQVNDYMSRGCSTLYNPYGTGSLGPVYLFKMTSPERLDWMNRR